MVHILTLPLQNGQHVIGDPLSNGPINMSYLSAYQHCHITEQSREARLAENGVSNKGLETVLQSSRGRLFSPWRVKGQCGGGKAARSIGGGGDNHKDRCWRHQEAADPRMPFSPALTNLLTQSKNLNPVIKHQRHISLKEYSDRLNNCEQISTEERKGREYATAKPEEERSHGEKECLRKEDKLCGLIGFSPYCH